MMKKKSSNGFSRRNFLKSFGAGTVAMLVTDSALIAKGFGEEAAPVAKGPSVRFERSRVPITLRSDVIVAGGSLAGVAAALEFARAGKKVVLVEHRTYLGREIAATLKPWVELGSLASAGNVPDVFAACLKKMGVSPAPGKIPLWMDSFKLSAEDLLLEAKVELIYASFPTEAIISNGEILGIVIGNKSGRQALLAHQVIDVTSTALVARLAGAKFKEDAPGDFRFVRMMEFDNVGTLDSHSIRVPSELGVAGDTLTVHRGYRGSGHILVECPIDLNLGKMDLDGRTQREIEARRRSMHVAAHLIQNLPAFSSAKLGVCALELDGAQTTEFQGPAPQWAAGLSPSELSLKNKTGDALSLSLADLAGPVKGLWCVNDAVGHRDLTRDPVNASLLGTALAQTTLPMLRAGKVIVDQSADYKVFYTSPHKLEVKAQDVPQRGRTYERLMLPPSMVPVHKEADVLVVGGGTCGATCASSAGREGAKTVVLDLNSGLGGAGTIGGVYQYFFGRYWAGFTLRNSRLVDEVHKSIHWPQSSNTLNQSWNIEAKMWALLKDACDAHVDVNFNTTVIAAVLKDDELRGVVAATPYGPMAILSQVTVDTTGDGDVAAFAGAKFVYGPAHEHYSMYCYLAEFLEPTSLRLDFQNSVDVSNIDDYTRAILVGRRLGPKCHDHGTYLAPRESRHIIGDVVVNYSDILHQREYPDVINMGAGTMDIHGKVTTDWLRTGFISPIIPTEMPFRALLPQGLDNIIVAAKAYSGKHDTLFNLRNQPDMENLGGSVGVAAAYSVRDKVAPRNVDFKKVQQRLTQVGTILPEMLTRTINDEPWNEAQVRQFVKELDGSPLGSWEELLLAREGTPEFRKRVPFVEICTADRSIAVPILEEELSKATGERKVRLAQALAMFASRAGVPVLIGEFDRALTQPDVPPKPLANGELPKRKWHCVPIYPADIVYCIGMCRDPRAIAVWDKFADLVHAEPNDFASELPWPFHYVDSICYGAMLLGDPAALPILKKLHSRPNLCKQSVREGLVIDFRLDRRALVELTLGRAMATLGDAEGYEALIPYLEDRRANLAEFADLTLQALTGRDDGKDPKSWSHWLDEARGSLPIMPSLERLDG
jgi:ribulose 1,5-bisphosphate synthetase/thiazole synthase